MQKISLICLLVFNCCGMRQLLAQSPIPAVQYFIKYNPASSVRGDHELSVQRINGNTAVEVSAGLTIGNPLLEMSQGRLFDNNYTPVSPRRRSAGYSIKLQAKKYMAEHFYISAQAAHLLYNYRFPLVNVHPAQTGEQKETIRYWEGIFLLGYEFLLVKGRLMLDVYTGVGMKNRTIRFFEEESYFNEAGDYVFDTGTYAVKENLPGIYFGIKTGWQIQ